MTCFASTPVAATRCPTKFRICSALVMSTSSIDEERFLRNPDFQLRDLGAPSPAVSFSQNVSSACSTQPVIVTVDPVSTVAPGTGSGAGGAVARSGAGFFAIASASGVDEVGSVIGSFDSVTLVGRAGTTVDVLFADAATCGGLTAASTLRGMMSVDASACVDASGTAPDAADFGAVFVSAGKSVRAMTWSGDGRRAAITTAAAMTHISPNARTCPLPLQLSGVLLACRCRAVPGGRDGFLTFFTRLDSFLSEILRMVRSAESKY